MSEITAGKMAYLLTTEEPTIVLEVRTSEKPSFPQLSGTTVVVRRPVASEADGIQHVIETFYLEELETADAKSERILRDMEQMKARIRGNTSEASPFSGLN